MYEPSVLIYRLSVQNLECALLLRATVAGRLNPDRMRTFKRVTTPVVSLIF